MKRLWVIIPLVLFALFLGLAGSRLMQPKDDSVRSTMVGKPLPEFDLPSATDDEARVSSAMFADGQPRLLNVWATWCPPCIAEAPQLEELKRRGVPIVGIAIRDEPEAIAQFLERYGDPYAEIGLDDIAELQLELGSSGVPETFLIDGEGVIRYQHIGDIRESQVDDIYAKWEAAR